MKKVYFSLILTSLLSLTGKCFAQIITYSVSGTYSYTVPNGATSITVDMAGAQGGRSVNGSAQGKGGRLQCVLHVSGGQVLTINVGGVGQNAGYFTPGPTGGFNGGGLGSYYGGSGGGATDIRIGGVALANRVAVAGGAGGSGSDCGSETGGNGGADNGGNGLDCGSYNTNSCGAGGSQSAGGAGSLQGPEGTGGLGVGGNMNDSYTGPFGGTYYYFLDGGGGGGGYYGGGAGYYGGGGGGSNFPANGATTAFCTSVVSSAGFETGDGYVKFCYPIGTITGSVPVCIGNTITLTNPTAGQPGTWTSSTPGVATVDPTTGIVTGVTAGTTTITYTVPNFCGATPAVATVTVNPLPTAITGTAVVCTGSTTTLGSTPLLGTWTSNNTAVATVGSSSGTVTGITAGFATITYTAPTTGCTTSTLVTVNQTPAPISGPAAVCQLASITLSSTPFFGTWSSSTPSVATVGSTSGVVTGVFAGGGVANITYTLPTGCFTSTPITDNPLPTQLIVAGGGAYCSPGGTGFHITLGGLSSVIGTSYQLLLGGVPVGPPLAGTGLAAPLDFGIQSAAGNYTVLATNTVTGCTKLMISSANIIVNPLPGVFTLSGGGSYCFGGTGINLTLSGSTVGVNYYLYLNGVNTGTFIPGTGFPLTYLGVLAAGNYTVVAQNASTGCSNNMTGLSTIVVNPPPAAFNVTGGGSYCIGGTGVPVGLSFSNTGISYQLMNGGPVGSPILGTGAPLNFGLQTAIGSYTVVATNTTTGCTRNMNFSATVNISALPNVYTVSAVGTGSYCAGGAGVDIILSPASDATINYQLYNGVTAVGSPVPGTGAVLDMGLQTAPGTYTVVGTDMFSGCTNNMSGSATVSINPLPTAFIVTGSGSYCLGGSGRNVGLSGTTSGIQYQLFRNSIPDSIKTGTGSAISFGLRTLPGVYTVVATNTATGCTNNMTGVATITINPLPTVFNVTGTGSYCAGGTGIPVGLDFASTGISYQLFRGTALGSPITGSGAPLTFGLETVAGTYTVVATNTTTGCVNNMAGSAVITINPLPNVRLVTGGGNYCAGGTGVHVGLNTSDTGINYQLFNGFSTVGGPVTGTGTLIDFGLQTAAGTYTVLATNNTTLCTKNMLGGAVVVVNPLPNVFTVTGGGIYCAGGTGVHVGLSGSNSGILYQLYNGVSTVGLPLTGSGGPLDFGAQAVSGTYTVVATNPVTGCTNTMASSTVVVINPQPVVFTVTGGGSYCAGGAGFNVGLDSSETGVYYQLFNGTAMVGSPTAGTGTALNFGVQTAAGIYTVVATNATTACTIHMASSVTITINPLPVIYTVSGGGNYCAGGAGLHIFQNVSTPGVKYQLWNGTTAIGSPIPGSGSGLDFGIYTAAGTYTVTARDSTTGCSSNMTGSATIVINPLPAVHTVTGGGPYCITGTGVSIGLNGSNAGISYQLYYGTSGVGTPVAGTSGTLDFGIHSTTGSYTIVATNTATGCSIGMTGAAVVSTVPLPTVYPVNGGGTICETSLGTLVGMSASDTGVNYQLYNGTTPVGIPVAGTGSSFDFGLYNAPGSYTVKATNATTACADNMTGAAVINVIPVVLPYVNIIPSITGIVCVGQTVNFNATPVNGGTGPTYQWLVNGVPSGVGSTFNYMPNDGDVITAVIHSNAACAIPATGDSSIRITVSAPQMPSVTVSADPGTRVCTGGIATFTASPLWGGTSPTLRWIKNSLFVGTGFTYSYTPVNGDIIAFMLGSDFPCRLADSVFSDNLTMEVEPAILPIVSINANPGLSVAPGQTETLTASVAHGGTNPTYQWVVNNHTIPGATTATFTSSTLNDRDSVTCEITGACGLVGFNAVIVHIRNVGVTQITTAGSDVRLVPNPNKGVFSLKGSLGTTNDQEVSLEVTNMLGQVIYTNKVMTQNGNIDAQIKLSSTLANGMYMLNMHSETENTVFHFVIEQ